MNRFSDQQLAIQIIENRSAGCMYRLFVCRMGIRYLALLGIVIATSLVLYALYALSSNSIFALMSAWAIGFGFGVFFRDWQWVVTNRRKWPFTEKTTDWEMVQKLADGIQIE